MTKTLITLCTYNECENIELLIPELHAVAPDATILIIDDNSPDGTGKLGDELSAADPRVQILHRAGKFGLGTATLAGFRYGIENGFDFVVNLDADFSHNPKYIPELLKRMTRCDVAIGSRYVEGGGVAGWTFRRKLMSQTINFWARLCLGLKTMDNSGSYRCYRISKLAEIDWALTMAKGYAFQEEVLYRCKRVGCVMSEVPIIFEDRRFGTTKINLGECLTAGWVIFALGIQRLLGYRVKRE
ncbi:MAG TPA: polyprenol monophosphomannose synthase [Planctomycetaceae bacterium]|nr:polyprenol monophosphomannose synthase [Planctomycetaceae bacterium]HRA88655.1 polyprenol monophosphomannose synthase [Planctomycetaceae bacterium]